MDTCTTRCVGYWVPRKGKVVNVPTQDDAFGLAAQEALCTPALKKQGGGLLPYLRVQFSTDIFVCGCHRAGPAAGDGPGTCINIPESALPKTAAMLGNERGLTPAQDADLTRGGVLRQPHSLDAYAERFMSSARLLEQQQQQQQQQLQQQEEARRQLRRQQQQQQQQREAPTPRQGPRPSALSSVQTSLVQQLDRLTAENAGLVQRNEALETEKEALKKQLAGDPNLWGKLRQAFAAAWGDIVAAGSGGVFTLGTAELVCAKANANAMYQNLVLAIGPAPAAAKPPSMSDEAYEKMADADYYASPAWTTRSAKYVVSCCVLCNGETCLCELAHCQAAKAAWRRTSTRSQCAHTMMTFFDV